MAYTIQEFLALDLSNSAVISAACTLCSHPITDAQQTEQTLTGHAHADCYYDRLSAIIELHPIGLPYVR